MAKVVSIIGDIMTPKFWGLIKHASGTGGLRDHKDHNLPRTEAAMIAMLYSLDKTRAIKGT